MSTNLAAIDIGTNSVLLLIASCDGGSRTPTAILERATITRLGQGVDKTRRLAPEAVQRTLLCLQEFSDLLRQHGVEHLDAVSTSATRDAQGVEAFLDAAGAVLGTRPQVISGEREAALTYSGALCGLRVEGPVAACDVGGGSTEIVFGRWKKGAEPLIEQAVSLDIGSVRLTERHLAGDPPSDAQINAARQDVRDQLSRITRPVSGSTMVGLAGTITTLAAIKLGLARYDGGRVHGSVMAKGEVETLRSDLGKMPSAARRQTPGLEPKRADIIVAGALIVEEVLGWAGVERMVVSDRGVRWGLVTERCRTL